MRVAVLGLGLVGGSVARALREVHDVVGFDPSSEVREQAAGCGVEVAGEPAAACAGADLVVLAGPVAANDRLLAEVPDGVLVTDVGSVKGPIVRRWACLPGKPRLVPGHPMAGSERAGWAASRADLFRGARWVLCPGQWAPPEDWVAVAEIVLGLGAEVVPADPARHDDAVAVVSHAPHVVAAALGAAVEDGGGAPLARSLAAGSFRDLTRVTASPPERTAAFCAANGAATARALREVGARLHRAADRLERGDADAVADLLRQGHRARQQADAARDTCVPGVLDVRLDDPRWADPLTALADAGGIVAGVERTGAGARLATRRPA